MTPSREVQRQQRMVATRAALQRLAQLCGFFLFFAVCFYLPAALIAAMKGF